MAFRGTNVPWLPLALGDLGVKLLMAAVLLIPFRLALNLLSGRATRITEALR